MPVACVLHRVYNDFKTGEVFGRHINHKYFSLKSNHKATATLKSFYQVKPMSQLVNNCLLYFRVGGQ